MKLAENLKTYREARGLTQEALAKKTGISQVMISRCEAGMKIPSLGVLVEIARVLETSIDELVK